MSKLQADPAALQAGIRQAIDALNACLVDNTEEFPKMMYHTNLAPKTVANEEEQKAAEAQGWSTEHNPASGTTPHAAVEPGFPKTIYKEGMQPHQVNTQAQLDVALSTGWTTEAPKPAQA